MSYIAIKNEINEIYNILVDKNNDIAVRQNYLKKILSNFYFEHKFNIILPTVDLALILNIDKSSLYHKLHTNLNDVNFIEKFIYHNLNYPNTDNFTILINLMHYFIALEDDMLDFSKEKYKSNIALNIIFSKNNQSFFESIIPDLYKLINIL